MRLTIDNASETFVHLVNTITGADFKQSKTCIIGDTRVDNRVTNYETNTSVDYSFTLALLETGKDADGEQLHEMRVIANRTVNLPWSKGNRTTITSIAISDQSPIDLNGLGLAIEHCIDRLSEQADVVSQHVRSEVAYV
jgi:hypothetical protein